MDSQAADNDYVKAVTRKTLCAAVDRVFNPGKKFDNMTVLNGAQGIGKSTLIARLSGDWYSDSLNISDMNDKTAAEKLQGYWILEIGELAGMRKVDIDKKVISLWLQSWIISSHIVEIRSYSGTGRTGSLCVSIIIM